MMLIDDERLTFVEGTVRRSIGQAMVEVGAAREIERRNGRARADPGQDRAASTSAPRRLSQMIFICGAATAESLRDYRAGARRAAASSARPIAAGACRRPSAPTARDGTQAARGGGAAVGQFRPLQPRDRRYATASNICVGRRRRRASSASELIGTGRVGDVRLRGTTELRRLARGAVPNARSCRLIGRRRENADWEGGLAYDAAAHRGRARITHIRRLDSMAIALTGEAATDGSLAFGVNLNFSLDPRRGFSLSRRPLAQAGAVHATVYRDLNDNGVRDPAEPLEKGALVTTGTRQADQPTDAKGSVTVGGLAAYMPVAVGIDETSLADPMLVPKKALQVVVPRPGVPADVEIGLVGGGDIEGAIVKSGGLGFEGLDLELVDAAGKVVAHRAHRFRRLLPVRARRLRQLHGCGSAKESAAAAKVVADLGVRLEVTPTSRSSGSARSRSAAPHAAAARPPRRDIRLRRLSARRMRPACR